MNSTNFVYKVAYLYDGMKTTNKKQVFRENAFRENIRYITTSLIVYHTWSVDIYRTETYLRKLYIIIYGIYRIDVINFAVH